eukprot:3025312-Rhodomonas_salina.2
MSATSQRAARYEYRACSYCPLIGAGTEPAAAAERSLSRGAGMRDREDDATLRNQTHEHTFSAQFVPGMRCRVFDFGV